MVVAGAGQAYHYIWQDLASARATVGSKPATPLLPPGTASTVAGIVGEEKTHVVVVPLLDHGLTSSCWVVARGPVSRLVWPNPSHGLKCLVSIQGSNRAWEVGFRRTLRLRILILGGGNGEP